MFCLKNDSAPQNRSNQLKKCVNVELAPLRWISTSDFYEQNPKSTSFTVQYRCVTFLKFSQNGIITPTDRYGNRKTL